MSLYIRDPSVDALATELQHRMGAKTKTEAVRVALEKALAAAPEPLSLAERIRPIQDSIKAMMGPHKAEFDEKAFMDEGWEV
ncbi:type II toxin-antitoxin system VapB family antitoxin [Rhizobium sp. C4]|uniref:type II toxin-antitoxin system VapB family antitoxin n=1 Tax=Rhizobium sp. C4 TaxID=1349800 RepID=UPI001E630857|nr:type II toxin-antitoxin system VapB family antitoxin [Rhizobium sp. C4]MCD2175807.1 type II toxin-antitoxin system VapB family antitoxin [Rhizobium sp. C4]